MRTFCLDCVCINSVSMAVDDSLVADDAVRHCDLSRLNKFELGHGFLVRIYDKVVQSSSNDQQVLLHNLIMQDCSHFLQSCCQDV